MRWKPDASHAIIWSRVVRRSVRSANGTDCWSVCRQFTSA
jgi:hypothetical protein